MEFTETLSAPEPQMPTAPQTTPQKQGGEPGPVLEKLEEQKPEEPEKESSVSAKFAALSRKEKATFKRIQELKERENKIAERESKIKEYEALIEKAKEDPNFALDKIGWNYEKLTNYFLNDKKVPEDVKLKEVEDRVTNFMKQQEEKERQAAEKAKLEAEERMAQTIETWKSDVKNYITSHKDDYELIDLHEAHELVTDLIQTQFSNSKKLLSTKEASDLVENYLEEQIQRATATKKWQSKYSKTTEEPQKTDRRESKTLSNVATSSAPSLLPAKSEQERIQRALAALNKSN